MPPPLHDFWFWVIILLVMAILIGIFFYVRHQKRKNKFVRFVSDVWNSDFVDKIKKSISPLEVAFESRNDTSKHLAADNEARIDKYIKENILDKKEYPDVNELAPYDLTVEKCDQPVYQRLMFANKHGRNSFLGCPIRGDLPIIGEPCGWFRPSHNPAKDLMVGAVQFLTSADTLKNQELIHGSSTGYGSFWTSP